MGIWNIVWVFLVGHFPWAMCSDVSWVEKTVTTALLVWKSFLLDSGFEISFFWFWVSYTWCRVWMSTFRASHTKLLLFWTTKYRPNTSNILVSCESVPDCGFHACRQQAALFSLLDRRCSFTRFLTEQIRTSTIGLQAHFFQTTNLCKLLHTQWILQPPLHLLFALHHCSPEVQTIFRQFLRLRRKKGKDENPGQMSKLALVRKFSCCISVHKSFAFDQLIKPRSRTEGARISNSSDSKVKIQAVPGALPLKQPAKGPFIKDVGKIFGILYHLPLLVRILVSSQVLNPRNLPHYVCFWANPLPPWCGRPLWMVPNIFRPLVDH